MNDLDAQVRGAAERTVRTLENDAKIAGSRVETLQSAIDAQKSVVSQANDKPRCSCERWSAKATHPTRSARAISRSAIASAVRATPRTRPADARIISRADRTRPSRHSRRRSRSSAFGDARRRDPRRRMDSSAASSSPARASRAPPRRRPTRKKRRWRSLRARPIAADLASPRNLVRRGGGGVRERPAGIAAAGGERRSRSLRPRRAGSRACRRCCRKAGAGASSSAGSNAAATGRSSRRLSAARLPRITGLIIMLVHRCRSAGVPSRLQRSRRRRCLVLHIIGRDGRSRLHIVGAGFSTARASSRNCAC